MSVAEDPFEVIVLEDVPDDFALISRRPLTAARAPVAAMPAVVIAQFVGFSLREEPLLSGLVDLPGEIVAARSTVRLAFDQIGSDVVVVFEQANVRRPIVIGVLEAPGLVPSIPVVTPQPVSVEADGDRLVLSAEREIVLRCGDASITLTRAGKVLIKGKYVLSHSAGHNRIKGAAVDIN